MRYWRRVAIAALVLAAILAAGLCLRRWGLGLERVSGKSMENTLASGDVVLVTRWDYAAGRTPARGDVVQCRFPGRADTYLKRVIGLPGDAVTFLDGALSVNGAPVPEPYVFSKTGDYEILLKDGQYLALGDNRAESYDSRMPDMGPLTADCFLGRARWVIWPANRIGPVD